MDWKIDISLPIYSQIVDYIKQDISRGIYSPGNVLPAAGEIAVKYKINPNAVLRAFHELVSQNILELNYEGRYCVSSRLGSDSEFKNAVINKVIKEFVDGMREFGVSDADIVTYVSNYVAGQTGEKI